MFAAHQTEARSGPANKANFIAIFDNVEVRKYFVEIDGVRYPKNSNDVKYATNDCVNQNRDPKLRYKKFVGEPLSNPFESYPKMKNFYHFQVFDVRIQVNFINPKKFQLFEE